MKIWISILLFTSLGFAAAPVSKATKKSPPKAKAHDEFTLLVNIGDKRQAFKVSKVDGKGHLTIHRLNRGPQEVDLVEKDYNFLLQEYKKIAGMPTNDQKLCPRSFIRLTYADHSGSVQKWGCVGSTNRTAVAMTELTNTFHILTN